MFFKISIITLNMAIFKLKILTNSLFEFDKKHHK